MNFWIWLMALYRKKILGCQNICFHFFPCGHASLGTNSQHSPKERHEGQIHGMALPATFVTPVTSSRRHLINGVGCGCLVTHLGLPLPTYVSSTSFHTVSLAAHWYRMAMYEGQNCRECYSWSTIPNSVETTRHFYPFTVFINISKLPVFISVERYHVPISIKFTFNSIGSLLWSLLN